MAYITDKDLEVLHRTIFHPFFAEGLTKAHYRDHLDRFKNKSYTIVWDNLGLFPYQVEFLLAWSYERGSKLNYPTDIVQNALLYFNTMPEYDPLVVECMDSPIHCAYVGCSFSQICYGYVFPTRYPGKCVCQGHMLMYDTIYLDYASILYVDHKQFLSKYA